MQYICRDHQLLVLKDSQRGKCVITLQDIPRGQVVIISHFLDVEKAVGDNSKILWNYYFEHREEHLISIIIGLGSFLNHALYPNLEKHWLREKELVSFTASRDIRRGEELTIDYGETWFPVQNPLLLSEGEIEDLLAQEKSDPLCVCDC